MRDRQTDSKPTNEKSEIARLSAAYDVWHQDNFASGELDQRSLWYQLVLEYLTPIKGKRVLEVACGRGGFATVLQSLGAEACSVDFSAAALRVAQQKMLSGGGDISKLNLVRADAHHLPFVDRAFDVVVSCETIEHLIDPPAAVREMARICKPGGVLYLTTPNYLNFMGLYLVYDAILRRDRRSGATQPLDHHWLFPRVRGIVKRSGWKIIRSDGTAHQVPIPGRNPVRLNFAERIPIVRRMISPFALHYFILARKRE
jgi:ubiquinone/menaquinone biosynthesis C-methylase UbiE